MLGKKIRILYLIGQLGLGGAEKQLVNLVSGLDRSLFEPVVCSLSLNSPLSYELHTRGIEVIVIPERMKPDLTRAWYVTKLVKDTKPDLIHSYLFVANTWARISGLIVRVPVIISERSCEINKPVWMLFIDRLLSHSMSLMIANSDAGKKLALSRHEVSSTKAISIHNGISLGEFDSVFLYKSLREEHGLSIDNPLIAMVGRLSYPKDHETFFEAVAKIIGVFPELQVLCVGDGPRLKELKQHANNLGLANKIVFKGFIDDIPSLMYAIDILVHSSNWEGTPNVILEAMAASKPVIATKVGGIPEIVQDGITGILVTPKNSDEMVSALQKLLLDKSLMETMGRNGREKIENEFTLQKMIQYTQEAYLRVLYNS